MIFAENDGYTRHARENGGGLRGVALLAILLCLVFFLSVGAYGFFTGEGVTEGDLPNAILVLRELVEENETVAVFLGLSEEADAALTEREARILAAAEEYIRAHQP